MRRALQALVASGLFITGFVSARALAAEDTEVEPDTRHNTEEPKQAEIPPPVIEATPAAAPGTPAAVKPKVGDISVSGYFRGGFGASSQKGRQVCFQLHGIGLFSKYRLGNECEVWSETHFTVVTYVGDDGSVATLHFMPTVFIPTTYIGYSPNGLVTAPDQNYLSTGATLGFPNLYADIKGIPWLYGGTAWAGTRYYKRESIYISDFFYWNPSGVGAGVEDINLGKDMRLSVAAFAVDGEPTQSGQYTSSLPLQIDFGVRGDIQLRGIRLWEGSEVQIGVQGIASYSDNPNSHGGWGATGQYVQKLLGGENKLALQYGRGGGTGFGTLSRFYYPDFSVRHDDSEYRFRAVDVLTIQPVDWYGQQLGLVYQHDYLGTGGSQVNWYSAGTRAGLAFSKHAKVLGEVGVDYLKKDNGSDPQFLEKFTLAFAITGDRQLLSRPELRLFGTWARWNETAAGNTVDSGRLYTDAHTDYLSGYTFGIQAETWW